MATIIRRGISAGQMQAAIAAATRALESKIKTSQAQSVNFAKTQVEGVSTELKRSAAAQSQFAEQKAKESEQMITDRFTKKTAKANPTRRRSIFTSKIARDRTERNLKDFYSLYS